MANLSLHIEGKLHAKNDTQNVSTTFRKREFVLEAIDGNPMYPQLIKLELVQDACEILEPFQVGDQVKASVNIRGREWRAPSGELKYFNTLQAWRIESAGEATQTGTTTTPASDAAFHNNDCRFS